MGRPPPSACAGLCRILYHAGCAMWISQPLPGAAAVTLATVIRDSVHGAAWKISSTVLGFGHASTVLHQAASVRTYPASVVVDGTDHAGIRPDIVVLSKALSGGMVPVGAVIARGEIIDDVFESMARSQVHSSTFKENVLAMVAGLASLHILEEERLERRARELGDLLRSRLEEVAGKTGCIRAVRGRGLMLGIELDIERMAGGITLPFVGRHRTTLVAQAVVRHLLLEHRVLALSTSADSATIKFTPPLVIEAEQVEQLAVAVQRTLERLDRTTLGAEIHGLAGMTRGLLTP